MKKRARLLHLTPKRKPQWLIAEDIAIPESKAIQENISCESLDVKVITQVRGHLSIIAAILGKLLGVIFFAVELSAIGITELIKEIVAVSVTAVLAIEESLESLLLILIKLGELAYIVEILLGERTLAVELTRKAHVKKTANLYQLG